MIYLMMNRERVYLIKLYKALNELIDFISYKKEIINIYIRDLEEI